ncbi:VCBS repeat-containing protein [Streptomyces sp. NPDC048643]|uniref:FG-GAP repeat domain-containing protein n=1 Tax=Streptomyces sp. NPDC048643 TaxID=3155637 RepID=UPI0034262F99
MGATSSFGGAAPLAAGKRIRTAWSGHTKIVGVGDITGDGKNDLVERDTAGNLHRNSGTGTGTFGSRVKISGGWQSCKGLFWPT